MNYAKYQTNIIANKANVTKDIEINTEYDEHVSVKRATT